VFNEEILPLILKETTPLGGRPPKISHYRCFCAMLAVLSHASNGLSDRTWPQTEEGWIFIKELRIIFPRNYNEFAES
jgi:hypothetical protein